MRSLDSRSLQHPDCFVQKFTSPGTVRYRVSTAAGACLPIEEPDFVIQVNRRARGREERQHNIVIRWDGRTLVADPARVDVDVGDLVLWHASDATVPGFAIQAEAGAFDSTSLVRGSVYTHVFGIPDSYEWVDANSGAVRGVVEVTTLDYDNREQCAEWQQALKDGKVITISGARVSPERVQILAGQTVFWVVEEAPGISITDLRLLR